MKSIWIFAAVVLASAAVVAQSQPPYVIHGLHTDLVFTDAVAMAEKLGGKCQITAAVTQQGETSAQCEYADCGSQDPAGDCKAQRGEMADFAIAAQPILRIGLEAPGTSAKL